MKINIKQDLTNSPKKELIKKLTLLFASYQVDQLKPYFAENIEWSLIGDEPIVGKENFANALKEMSGNKAIEIIIHNIIAQEKEAAIHGEMKMADGQRFGFSDFYQFTNKQGPMVESITSYVIKL